MAKSIFWRDKVVCNFVTVVLALLAAFHVNAQSIQLSKITYTCKSTNPETVLNDLSKLTGVSFVYSSNKITTSTLLSFSVKDKSLNEVLTLLGKQLNLSFKIQDQHITVKSNAVPLSAPLVAPVSVNKIQLPIATEANREMLATTTPFVPSISEKMRSIIKLPANNNDVSKYVVKLQPYFNPALLKNVPVSYVKSAARNMNSHRWFVAAGPIVNSYSTGVEVQAGIKKLYAVFSPSWMENDKFHGAFGVGTALKFSETFSLQPIYTYASLKESTTSGIVSRNINEPAYKVNSSVSHHQIKLMMQYSVSKKISLRAGPTFNQSKSTSKYSIIEPKFFTSQDFTHAPPGEMQSAEPPHTIHFGHASQNPAEVTTNKLWVGWEIAFSYRINF